MVIWDDHEVANDYGGDQDRTNPDPKVFLRRRAAAYQVFYENMPLRRAQMPKGPDLTLYRSLEWGDLARIDFVDDRQYRNHRTCESVSDGKRIPADCPERFDPKRSLLGKRQEKWLRHELGASRARWNVLAQQTLMGEFAGEGGKVVGNDGWDGYVQTRRRVLETWRDRKVPNPIALGGDVHCFFAAELSLERGGPVIASEFVGGSITSLGRPNFDIVQRQPWSPHLKFGDGETRGYGRVEITPKATTVTFRGVQNAVVDGSPVRDLAKFVVEDGVRGLKRV
jgi:alkaline phosphatase D